jgi:hypothetical protein
VPWGAELCATLCFKYSAQRSAFVSFFRFGFVDTDTIEEGGGFLLELGATAPLLVDPWLKRGTSFGLIAVSGMLSTDLVKSETEERAVAGGWVRMSPNEG